MARKVDYEDRRNRNRHHYIKMKLYENNEFRRRRQWMVMMMKLLP